MASPTEKKEWKFSQVVSGRSEELTEGDIISTLEFDPSGNFLALGNKGGKVTLLRRKDSNSDYHFYHDFQSHEPEFDYLKSSEIEEKINKIKFCNPSSGDLLILTTNDKTIKLWKVSERKAKEYWKSTNPSTPALVIPKVKYSPSNPSAATRRIYANAHAYHINSISPSSDHETFISSDDLRINLWNFSITKESFTIVDIKPANMEDLSEVITSAEFHPSQCNIFVYSTSKGSIKLADMRHSALCDASAKVFEDQGLASLPKSFFSEIISSISDIKFTADGRYLISRDYLTTKVWDLNMENKPLRTIPVHDHVKSKLCDLYENDSIFDKFETTSNSTGEFICTGSYQNQYYIHSLHGSDVWMGEANKYRLPPKSPAPAVDPNTMDFGKKALYSSWNPADKYMFGVAASTNVFLYK